jgi:hypothetical protein
MAFCQLHPRQKVPGITGIFPVNPGTKKMGKTGNNREKTGESWN